MFPECETERQVNKMVLLIEAIVLCIIFSVMVYIMSQEPLKTLYNYPPKI